MLRRALLALALAACSAGPAGPASPAPTASASAARPPVDLGPEDPRVIELAKPALACPWDAKKGFAMQGCEAFSAWDRERALFDHGAMDRSLVRMLGRDAEGQRFLAAEKLLKFGEKAAEDPGLAELLVAAAERERAEPVAASLGRVVGQISFEKTGLAKRVLGLARSHPSAAFRAGVLERVGFANAADRPAILEVARDALKDANAEVRQSAVLSLWQSSKTPGACDLLAGAFGDADAQVSTDALRYAANAGACASKGDAVLDEVDRRVKAKKADSYELAIAVADVCGRGSAEQRKRGAGLAKALLEGKHGSSTRERALVPVAVCDEGWRDVLKKYVSDPDKDVATKAKQLLEEGKPRIW